jgi:hypothetical protein
VQTAHRQKLSDKKQFRSDNPEHASGLDRKAYRQKQRQYLRDQTGRRKGLAAEQKMKDSGRGKKIVQPKERSSSQNVQPSRQPSGR